MNHPSHIMRACTALAGPSSMAKLIGVSSPTVSQWLSGKRPVPAKRCVQIERATEGAVRCEDLRPDIDWSVLRTPARDL